MSNSGQRALVRFAATLLTWTGAFGIIHAQRPTASALDLVNSPRALTSDEVQMVLEGVRAIAAGKAFHLGLRPDLSGGPELVMGADGRPEWVRTASGYDFG